MGNKALSYCLFGYAVSRLKRESNVCSRDSIVKEVYVWGLIENAIHPLKTDSS